MKEGCFCWLENTTSTLDATKSHTLVLFKAVLIFYICFMVFTGKMCSWRHLLLQRQLQRIVLSMPVLRQVDNSGLIRVFPPKIISCHGRQKKVRWEGIKIVNVWTLKSNIFLLKDTKKYLTISLCGFFTMGNTLTHYYYKDMDKWSFKTK